MTKHDLPYGVERSGRAKLPFKARLKDPITGERWRGGDGFPGSNNFADEWEADAWRRGKQRELDALYGRYQPLDKTTAAGTSACRLWPMRRRSRIRRARTTGELYNRFSAHRKHGHWRRCRTWSWRAPLRSDSPFRTPVLVHGGNPLVTAEGTSLHFRDQKPSRCRTYRRAMSVSPGNAPR